MLSKDAFESLLEMVDTLIADGALATELEARGHDLNHPLWSAKILQDEPSSIEQVHLDYFAAGAYIAITASYQAATEGLTKHLGLSEVDGKDLIKRSVDVARQARDKAYVSVTGRNRPLLIAGSVGPYGAFLSDGSEYTGAYQRTSEQYMDFHRPRIAALIDAGADLLALETMPNLDEIKALLELLRSEFPSAIAWLSCTVKDFEHLADGSSWADVLDVVKQHDRQIVSFGINCVPMAIVTETLGSIRQFTSLPLIAYPNSGETWDAVSKTWHGKRAEDILNTEERDAALSKLSAELEGWTANGVRLVGGCCRTGPAYVRACRNHFERRC
ncbi:Putative Homocysteine-binding domain, betaine-homocysteine S-methyltransferase, BHMT [Septoria linicola]|uniref:Homocysteine-binding domain, betaine-homocysteine S-methyltransferase, BHMT n=1 Tax=Septoria linicola TaxID=215465 RepID=A0A9Q9AI86_9PEZI|nr:putative Homocysteine-binding domain, betaine-homocysteine S-methyltransferase, BHMT [Septoria linicola]USW46900.1 Putative Homocysteine-binding domain, betaine-homocysteine S-methyltransferase, BHMT [Septoria linicola]